MNTPEQILNLLLKNHPELKSKLQEGFPGVVGSSVGHGASWAYARNPNCLLTSLCDKYGSDKGSLRSHGHPYPWPAHTYTDYYARLWSHCRAQVKRVFECGLGTNNPTVRSNMGKSGRPGASLRVWRDYFPNAQVVGADIDRGVLFQEERISTYYVDQLNPSAISEMWSAARGGKFDFMVDDGLHEFRAGITLFENSIARLSDHGIYVIEDVNPVDLKRYFNYFSDKKYVVDYVSLHRPAMSLGDNSIVSIRLD